MFSLTVCIVRCLKNNVVVRPHSIAVSGRQCSKLAEAAFGSQLKNNQLACGQKTENAINTVKNKKAFRWIDE